MRAKFIEERELEALKNHLGGRKDEVLLVAELTGLRIGDVVKIRVSDLDEDGVRYVAEKTGKAGRAPLPPVLVKKLRAQARYGWVFPSPSKRGRHLTRQAAWARIKRAAERAGVPREGVSPHSLRKVYAVRKYQSEGIDAARRALQHSDARTTELYALSDWLTGENAVKPLLRGDLALIIEKVVDALHLTLDK